MATTAPQLIFAGLTIPPAKAINAAAAQRTLTLAADRSIIPLTYGEDRVPGQLLNALISATDPGAMLLQVLWGWGCDSISLPRLNGEALPAGATITHYTGTQTTVDTALAAAFAAQSITYTDTLEGYAYSVLKLPVVAFTGQLQISAWIRGRKVYDPRKDSTAGGTGSHRLANPATWEWSDCPALCLADWVASTAYGAGEAVAWASVPAAANANDAMIGSPAERRRVIGLTISAAANVADMAEALRAYAGCWLVPTASGMRLLPDADAAPAATYSHAAGDIAYIAPLQLPDRAAAPTVVEVVYSDLSTGERREIPAEAALPGVGSTLPYRLSQVRLPGIGRYSQALREAIERLNKLSLEGVATTLEVFDQGIVHERGDIISVTHPIGLTAATMRVVSVDMAGPGRWVLDLMRHDPLSYSDSVVTAGTIADPSRRINPGPASNVTGAAATVSAGLIRVTWAPCPDTGYDSTEVRTANGDWGSYTVAPLFRGKASEFPYLVTAAGAYTFHLRHISNGNPSAATTTVTLTVTPGDLPGSAAGSPLLSVAPVSALVQADAVGAVSDWSTARATLRVTLPDGSDDTANGWTYTVDSTTNLAATLVGAHGHELRVTGFASGVVDAQFRNAIIQLHGYPDARDTSQYGRAPRVQHSGVTFVNGATPVGQGYMQLPAGESWSAGAGGGGMVVFGDLSVGPNQDTSLVDACGQPWTMSMWVNVTTPPTTGSATWQLAGYIARYIGIQAATGSSDFYVVCRWQSDVAAPLGAFGTSTLTSLQHGALANNTWHHVQFSYCADGSLRLWVNGVLRDSHTVGANRFDNFHPDSPYSTVFGVGVDWGNWGAHSPGVRLRDVRHIAGVGGPTSGNIAVPTATFNDSPAPTTGAVAVKASKAGQPDLFGRFDVSVLPGAAPSVTVSAVPQALTLPADWQGVASGPSAPATMVVNVGGQVDPPGWGMTVQQDQVSGLVGTLSGRSITATGMSSGRTAGEFRVWMSAPGYAARRAVISVAKVAGTQPVVIPGGPTLLTVAGATDGSVPAASLPLSATVTALQAGADMATSYSWVPTASAGLTATNTGGAPTVQLTAMTTGTDSGTITMTGTRTGWPTLVWVIAVTKTRLLLPTGQVVRVLPPATAYDEGSTSLDVSVRYTSDGLIQTYTESTATWTTVGNWYWPTTTGIGSSHRVRINVSSTAGLTGTFNDWVSLSSDVTYTAAATTSGSSVVLAARAYIVTSSGTTVLGQGDVNLVSTFQGA